VTRDEHAALQRVKHRLRLHVLVCTNKMPEVKRVRLAATAHDGTASHQRQPTHERLGCITQRAPATHHAASPTSCTMKESIPVLSPKPFASVWRMASQQALHTSYSHVLQKRPDCRWMRHEGGGGGGRATSPLRISAEQRSQDVAAKEAEAA
jgi:hypothetical protein